MIEVRHLCKKYPQATPLKDINTTIRDGDVISIIGPSGTGKSTFLRCLNRLEEPSGGEIYLDGVNVTDPATDICAVRKRMGMVFQSFNLFGHLTVLENVMNPQMDLLGRTRQEAYDRAVELLNTVGLAGREFNYPDMLSGGQKQRVAIARTLAMECDVILFDEPTSALDPAMVGEVQAVIRRLAKLGKTMLIVTHEMKFAREVANRVFYMDEGLIYEDGTPEQIFDHPEKEKTRRFINRIKELAVTIDSPRFDYASVISEIEKFAEQNFLDRRTGRRLEMIYEELVCNILIPHLGEDVLIHMNFEYSERDNHIEIKLDYNGEPFELMESEDALAVSIVKSYVSEIRKTGENNYLLII